MRGMIRLGAFAGVAAGVAGSAWADSASLISKQDNTLYQTAAGTPSNGAGPGMFCGTVDSGEIRRALLSFDLSTIPAGSTVTSATLTLYMDRSTSAASDVSLRRVLASWGQGTSNAGGSGGAGAAATPGDATWAHRFYDTTPWSSSGGDFSATITATKNVGSTGFYSWGGTQLAADVQSWVDNPNANFGWGLWGDESVDHTAKRFVTREGVAGRQPTLLIEYTVPAPGALALVAGGLSAVARRRRR